MPVPHPEWLPRATKSAVIVPVPETDPLVASHRRALSPKATASAPAHVTVLYPFVPPSRICEGTIATIEAALAGFRAFDCVFDQVKWFDDEVVWLEPSPDEHFRALTRAMWNRFPAHPPYAGEHPDTVPHLTVVDSRIGDPESKRRAAVDISSALPIHARIDRVRLVAGDDERGPWRTITEFQLS